MKTERPRTPCALKEQVVRPNLDYVHYDGDDDNYDMQIMPNRKIIVPCTVVLLCIDNFFFHCPFVLLFLIKWILRKLVGSMYIAFISLRTGASGRL
jgi:hypothetical protein